MEWVRVLTFFPRGRIDGEISGFFLPEGRAKTLFKKRIIIKTPLSCMANAEML